MKEIEIFRSEDEKVSLEVQIENESVWLNQEQMTNLFQTTKQNISLHINNIFREEELEKDSTVKDFLTVAANGKTYSMKYYNLDVIISVGYRVKSKRIINNRNEIKHSFLSALFKHITIFCNDTKLFYS